MLKILNTELNNNGDKKSIQIAPFTVEKEKFPMWSLKFTARAEIKGYNIILRDNLRTSKENANETQYGVVNSMLKILNKISYN